MSYVEKTLKALRSYRKISDWNHFAKEFDEVYEGAIKEQIGKANYILVSCHPETRAILKNLGIHYYIAYPDRSLKEEYLERYRKRGDSIEFTNLLSNNFDYFINSIESDDYEDCTKIRIVKPGRYVIS